MLVKMVNVNILVHLLLGNHRSSGFSSTLCLTKEDGPWHGRGADMTVCPCSSLHRMYTTKATELPLIGMYSHQTRLTHQLYTSIFSSSFFASGKLQRLEFFS